MLDCEREVDLDLLKEIKDKCYSRIPIYYGPPERQLIIGILLVRSLVGLDIEKITGQRICDLVQK